MYRYLGTAPLKTGEQLQLGVVECPDPSWEAQVVPLLGHKGQHTKHHFGVAFAGPLDSLETRFYLGTVGGVAVSNAMVVGTHRGPAAGDPAAGGPAAGVGIMGHVYTRPEHRRKGAFQCLMAAQMEDSRRLGYRALTLGTGFETPPYRIYHGFGYRSIDGVSGKMWWLSEPAFLADWFGPAETRVRPLRWDDWAPLNLLSFLPAAPGEPQPRSWAFRVRGQGGGMEAGFQQLQRSLSRGSPISALVLESERGASVGWAVLQPDDLTFGDGWLLDLYVHPQFEAGAPELLAALPWPDSAPVRAYTTTPPAPAGDDYRTRALSAAGFRVTAALPDWFAGDGAPLDLQVWTRRG
jgi:GNAT superfamily N-acetyltransferase